MTIPPVEERQQRACNDNDEQREFDEVVHFCRYHMTIYEYRELIDTGM